MARRKTGKDGLFAGVARRPSHRPGRAPVKPSGGIPGPSENQATNFLLADIVIRAGSYIVRRGVEKRLLANRYGKQSAREIVRNKTLGQTLVSQALARIATRSTPGAIVVGCGALAKALFDRRRSRLAARIEGDRAMLEQARDEQAP